MVKLIRLTSEDNCNFKANLDDGIQLNINSKIALQNLTFNAEFDVLVVDATNREVKFTLNSYSSLGQNMNVLTGLLTMRTYTSSEVDIFYRDLEGALNETLRIDATIPTNGNVYGNFQVRNEKEKVLIEGSINSLRMSIAIKQVSVTCDIFTLSLILDLLTLLTVTRSRLFIRSNNVHIKIIIIYYNIQKKTDNLQRYNFS